MTEFQFLLNDRISKIQSINEMYDLENKSYISFSGGKDSTVLSHLMDMALPGNNIPRLFLNTGIEYKAIVQFVREWSAIDERIQILTNQKNIREILETCGYPFKSKEHSQKLALFQRSGMTKTVSDYLGKGKKKTFLCPEKLKYQFSENFKLKVSDKCCFKMKKEPAQKWAEENGKSITITGIRNGEGGLRQSVKGCAIFDKNGLHKFHPLLPLEENWINEFVKTFEVELCELYSPPFNFERTGCVGCPFQVGLNETLFKLQCVLPSAKKQAEAIWKPVYEEYRRIGFRLEEKGLFD